MIKITAAGAIWEKNDLNFSKRQASIQLEVGTLNLAIGLGDR